MSVIGTLQQIVGQYRARRERNRTIEIVNALPPDIRRDIGWPGFYPDITARADRAHHRR